MAHYWDGIVGQSNLKDFFSSLLESRKFPQSVIIAGESGTGKDFISARLASALNYFSAHATFDGYKNPAGLFSAPYIKYIFSLPRGTNEESHDDPFEKLTQPTLKIIRSEIEEKNSNPYHTIEIDGANEIKINSIRDIQKFLGMTSSVAHHKTILISSAELMNEYAQNSLLKILEEPPENATLILTTNRPSALKETIRSRCWELLTVPFTDEEMTEILRNNFGFDDNDILPVLHLSGGSVTDALSLMDFDIAYLKARTIEFLRFALGNKYDTAYNHLQETMGKGDAGKILLQFRLICLWLADAERFLYDSANLYFSEYLETFQKFHARFSITEFHPYIREIERYAQLFEHNNCNKNILYLNLVHLIASITNKHYNQLMVKGRNE